MGAVIKKTKYGSIREMAEPERAIFARKITEVSLETELTWLRGKSRKLLNRQKSGHLYRIFVQRIYTLFCERKL